MSGATAGFSFSASATQFSDGSHPLGYPTVTGASTSACSGNKCVTSVNTIAAYPLSLASAVKIYSSTVGSGTIPITFSLALAIPANAFASGTYSSTLTVTVSATP